MQDKRINNILQSAYVRRYTLTDAGEDGLKVIEVNNGVLRFLLNESRALDIMQLWHRGTNIGFVSKNGFRNQPLPFGNRFEGGMLYTCGLENIGARNGFEPHGSFHKTPARLISAVCNGDNIEIVAQTYMTSLFGEQLSMKRKITTKAGSDFLTVSDILENLGFRDEKYCLLYHVNVGYPMLDSGVIINADCNNVIPRTDYAAKHADDRCVFEKPQDNEEERCYFLDGARGILGAENRLLGRKFTLEYSKDTLPAVVQWNSPASHDYALGLEPATSFLDDRFEYRVIGARQTKEFTLRLSVKDI